MTDHESRERATRHECEVCVCYTLMISSVHVLLTQTLLWMKQNFYIILKFQSAGGNSVQSHWVIIFSCFILLYNPFVISNISIVVKCISFYNFYYLLHFIYYIFFFITIWFVNMFVFVIFSYFFHCCICFIDIFIKLLHYVITFIILCFYYITNDYCFAI